LSSQAALAISSGSLALAATSNENYALTLSGGTLNVAGDVTVTGLFSCIGGSALTGSGSLTTAGGMVINGGISLSCTLNNAGTASVSGGASGLSTGATINNLVGATIDFQGPNLWSGAAGVTFTNAGTIVVVAGVDLDLNFSNSGLVQVQSGRLWLEGDSTTPIVDSGTFTGAAGTTLEFLNNPLTFTAASSIQADAVIFGANGGNGVAVTLNGSYSAATSTSLFDYQAPGCSVLFTGPA
jgi:hypothetical protein